MSNASHWESVYESKQDLDVSWTLADPKLSLSFIRDCLPTGRVIDVGGGTSPLAGKLLNLGYSVTVVDISQAAIERARTDLGAQADRIQWIVADVTKNPEVGDFEVWHDRAVFHFLTSAADRRSYTQLLRKTLTPVGYAIFATFDLHGPERCSGLEVCRYNSQSLAVELGPGFSLLKSVPQTHLTPRGQEQAFQYSVFKRL